MIGGEQASKERLANWLRNIPSEVRLINAYGPTETTISVTMADLHTLGHAETADRIHIGKPLRNSRAYILDNNLQLLPVGIGGELYIGGVQVARGYLNRPELSMARFIKNPFSDDPHAQLYKSGDLARYLPDGNIEYLGRIDFQVKLRGFRIEPGEVESMLCQHVAVKECVVIVREDTPGDQRLVAYLIPEHDDIDTHDLLNILKTKLPAYMVPADIVALDAFPLTSNGKIDRNNLPLPARYRSRDAGFIAPRTPYESRLAGIWAESLSLENPGIHDNFFELGGHSLLATRVISRINRDFGIQLPLRELFENPTIEGLAQAIVRNKTQSVADTNLMDMLTQLENLSDADAEQQLRGKSK